MKKYLGLKTSALFVSAAILSGCGGSGGSGEGTTVTPPSQPTDGGGSDSGDYDPSQDQALLAQAYNFSEEEIKAASLRIVEHFYQGKQDAVSSAVAATKSFINAESEQILPNLPSLNLPELQTASSEVSKLAECEFGGTLRYQGKTSTPGNYIVVISYRECEAISGQRFTGDIVQIAKGSESGQELGLFFNDLIAVVERQESKYNGFVTSAKNINVALANFISSDIKHYIAERSDESTLIQTQLIDEISQEQRLVSYSGSYTNTELGQVAFSTTTNSLYPIVNRGDVDILDDAKVQLTLTEQYVLLKQKDDSGQYNTGQFFPDLRTLAQTPSINPLPLSQLAIPKYTSNDFFCLMR